MVLRLSIRTPKMNTIEVVTLFLMLALLGCIVVKFVFAIVSFVVCLALGALIAAGGYMIYRLLKLFKV